VVYLVGTYSINVGGIMAQVEGVVPGVRLHSFHRRHAERLEGVLSRDVIEHIAMSSPDQAEDLIACHRSQILRSSDSSPGERTKMLAALTNLARSRPMAPPLDAVLPQNFLRTLRDGHGFELIPVLQQAVEYIRTLRLHPLVQQRSIEGIRALADSLVMA